MCLILSTKEIINFEKLGSGHRKAEAKSKSTPLLIWPLSSENGSTTG